MVVKRYGVATPVRQHAVVPQVVLQVPDVRIRDARATLGGDGSVVAGIGVDHRNCAVINAIIRCIFRALDRAAGRLFLHIQLFPVDTVDIVYRIALSTDILLRQVQQIVPHHIQRVTLGIQDFRSVADGIVGIKPDEKDNAPIYDLNGRRLDKSQKGINIIGGKKVFKK